MVKNNFDENVKNSLNGLLTLFFQANSAFDNMAYALDCELDCHSASDVFHQKFAHLFPGDKLADNLSEVMINEGVRPVRGALSQDSSDYENIVVLFEDAYNLMNTVKQQILNTIELLDYNKDCKVFVIELEEMARYASVLLHQCDVWKSKAKAYFEAGRVYKFDIDFEEFTFI